MSTLEQTFQERVMIAVNAPRRPTRLVRQNVGTVPVRNEQGRLERFFHAGPKKGAADLSGLVRPEGWRLEVECKSATAPWKPAQKRWGRFIASFGGVYVLIRYREALTLEENVRAAVQSIDEAIRDRRARSRGHRAPAAEATF